MVKKAKEKKEYHRAWPLDTPINLIKEQKVREVYHHFKSASAATAKYQWRLLFQGNINFSIWRNWLPEASLLNDRFLREVEANTVETLESFISNRQNDFRSYVNNSSLDEETKHKLHTINCWKAWYYRRPEDIKETLDPRIVSHLANEEQRFQRNNQKRIQAGKEPVIKAIPPYLDYEISNFNLARRIMKILLKKNKLPSFNYCNMRLSANVASLVKRVEQPLPKGHLNGRKKCFKCKDCHSAKRFTYWIKFSTLEFRKPVYLPAKDYPALREQLKKGKLCQSLQFNFDNFGKLQIAAIVEKIRFKHLPSDQQKQRLIEYTDFSEPLSGEIGLDRGLVVAFATDQGDLHGLSFYEQLKKYDKRLVHLSRELNKQNIPLRSNKRYLHLQQDIKGYIKNEMNRCLNRIVTIHRPAKIIVDLLNFSDSHLSRRLNRILRNCGIGAVKDKLQSLSEELGIEIVWINPAYTSRECYNCGYVDRNNRKNRDLFKCKLCNYTIHADVSGAKQSKARSSRDYPWPITVDTPKGLVLRSIVYRFVDQFRSLQKKDPGNWLLRLRSKAKILLQKNPYYRCIIDTPDFREVFC